MSLLDPQGTSVAVSNAGYKDMPGTANTEVLEASTTAEFNDVPGTANTGAIQDDNSAGSVETTGAANTVVVETDNATGTVTGAVRAPTGTTDDKEDWIIPSRISFMIATRLDLKSAICEVTADTSCLNSGVPSSFAATELAIIGAAAGVELEPDKANKEENLWRQASTVH